MWIKLGDTLLGPLIESWRFVRRLQRDIVKDDGEPAPLPCTSTAGRFPRRRRCTLPAFHSGPHEYGQVVGRVYLERGEPVTVLRRWAGAGPRNVLIERAGEARVVRPFRGLRRVKTSLLTATKSPERLG